MAGKLFPLSRVVIPLEVKVLVLGTTPFRAPSKLGGADFVLMDALFDVLERVIHACGAPHQQRWHSPGRHEGQ